MNNIFRNIMYQGKNMYRDKGFLFWTFIYPLIMAIFFYTAFSGILDMDIQNINVGIEEGNPIEFVLGDIDIINVHKVSLNNIDEKLESEEISGFIDKDLNLRVKESGLEQTIIKEIIDQVKQMVNLNRPMEAYDFSIDYTMARNQQANSIIITFYSLIAMVSTYGIFPGIEAVGLIQANLSSVGTRINVVPLRKNIFLLAGIVVALSLNLLSNGILLLFIRYILKIELFNEIKYSAIFIILGNLFGVSFGMFIGASNKSSTNVKTMIGIMTTLFLSFLSGMMGPWMKVMVDHYAPILSKLNPITIVSSNLYRINLLESTKSASQGIVALSIYCIIFTFISYGILRRRNYDSI